MSDPMLRTSVGGGASPLAAETLISTSVQITADTSAKPIGQRPIRRQEQAIMTNDAGTDGEGVGRW
ncbi:hypothetical protein YTPLAS18_20050 [Nitrospira sp.]|nr:hypothetical protein YTPLAS18_20050 [Nitrospira sp.]